MRLNIPPLQMWEMPFYDIMLLYKTYEDYVNEENKQQEQQQQQYEEQLEQQQMQQPSLDNFKMPDINNISRGMMNSAMSGFNIPGL